MKKLLILTFIVAVVGFVSCNSLPAPAADQAQTNQVEFVQQVDQVSAPVHYVHSADQVSVPVVQTDDVLESEVPTGEAEDSGGVLAKAYGFLDANWGTIATILLLLSELIGGSKLQSNSLYQLILPFLKKGATRVTSTEIPA